eukprot:5521032-Amphidinium_carterae.1
MLGPSLAEQIALDPFGEVIRSQALKSEGGGQGIVWLFCKIQHLTQVPLKAAQAEWTPWEWSQKEKWELPRTQLRHGRTVHLALASLRIGREAALTQANGALA